MMKKLLLLSLSLIVLTTTFLRDVEAQQSIFDTSASSLFNNESEFLKPDQAFPFNFIQEGNHVSISFDIVDGYYLYKQKFSFSADGAILGEVVLPQGVDHEDEFFGKQQIYDAPVSFIVPVENITNNATLNIRFQGCAKKGLCFPPEIKTISINQSSAAANDILTAMASTSDDASKSSSSTAPSGSQSEQFELADMLKGETLWITLLAFFAGGLLLSFTPCVFPMYPILSGIIVGQKNSLTTKRAFSLSFFYVQGMAITYTILGVVVALAGAQFQAMFQHPAVLIALSILFIFLALSMFGVFNLALPSSWQNKLNELSNEQKSGSYWGVFAMGAISGLVASPCTTAPLTGALIYISQTGDVYLGAAALYALSLGMGLPLLVLGSSGGKLLPKAGPWMDIIKNIFGLMLLMVPVFLLERFLPATISLVLWLLLILVTFYYFMHVNMASKTSPLKHLRSVAIAGLAVAAIFYIQPTAITASSESSAQSSEHSFIFVNNLAELEEAVAKANADGKTVMVDLYADWCAACKEFEHKTFPKPEVREALKNTVLIQIDLTDTGSPSSFELMQHFDVFGLPSILFFDLNGQELDTRRVTGFMAAPEFAAHVNQTFK